MTHAEIMKKIEESKKKKAMSGTDSNPQKRNKATAKKGNGKSGRNYSDELLNLHSKMISSERAGIVLGNASAYLSAMDDAINNENVTPQLIKRGYETIGQLQLACDLQDIREKEANDLIQGIHHILGVGITIFQRNAYSLYKLMGKNDDFIEGSTGGVVLLFSEELDVLENTDETDDDSEELIEVDDDYDVFEESEE